MKTRADKKNVTKSHVIFRGTQQSGDDWHDAEERALWHPDVIVSFHPNAWLDTKTFLDVTPKMFGPVDKHLTELNTENETSRKAVVFMDNLTVHTTDSAAQMWANEFDNFLQPKFVPANHTDSLQVLDRHIGVRYKKETYFNFRKDALESLKELRKNAGTADGVVLKRKTPRERRILITHSIGEAHKRVR